MDRGAPDGDPIGPGEALTAREAIASYIHGGASAMSHEAWRGRLEPGMAADLIALDRNPFADTVPDLRRMNVLMTMVRGEIHHNAAFQQNARSAIVSA